MHSSNSATTFKAQLFNLCSRYKNVSERKKQWQLQALLLSHPRSVIDAQINARNRAGNTALHVLCTKPRSFPSVAVLLTWPTLSVNVQNRDGNTALHCACSQRPIPRDTLLALLAQPNIDLWIRNGAGQLPIQRCFLDDSEARECFGPSIAEMLRNCALCDWLCPDLVNVVIAYVVSPTADVEGPNA